jgi:hypothetical protein
LNTLSSRVVAVDHMVVVVQVVSVQERDLA